MGIQCFLNFGDICHIYFRDMGYFSESFKGYGILGPPPPFPEPQSFGPLLSRHQNPIGMAISWWVDSGPLLLYLLGSDLVQDVKTSSGLC